MPENPQIFQHILQTYAQRMAENDGKTSDAFERISKWFDVMKEVKYEGHGAALPTLLTLESALSSPTPENPHHALVTFSMAVPHDYCNMSGNLHGGAVALIFDLCTSVAVHAVSSAGFWDTGHVSRTLNCTYLRPAPEGSRILIECEVLHLGTRMGQLRGLIRLVDEEGRPGKVCYTCEHGKAVVGGKL